MAAINTDRFTSQPLQTAGTGFAAAQSIDGLFDKQLRMAIKPAESKDRAAADDGALRRPESPENGEKPEKTKGDDKRADNGPVGNKDVGNEDAGEKAGDIDKNESRPGANEDVADGETAEMLNDGSGLQGPWPNQQPAVLDDSAAAQPVVEPVLDPTADVQDASAKTDPANRPAEAKGEIEKAGLSQAQAALMAEGELNAGEIDSDGAAVNPAVEEGKPSAAPAEVSVNQDSVSQDVAKQSQAAVVGSENKEAAEQKKDRRAATDGPIAANAQEADSAEIQAVEKTEPITSAIDRDMGDTKPAATETSPAATALGPRGAAGREVQTGATPQATSGEETDPVDRVRFVQRVARAFEGVGRDGGTLRIRLHPSELGSLRLDVAIRNGVMTARLETETQAAKNILLDNLPALRDRLEQQNIKIERFDIDYSGGNNDQPSRNAADGHQHKDRLDGRPYGSPPRDDRESGAGESRETPRARRLGETSQLDVVA